MTTRAAATTLVTLLATAACSGESGPVGVAALRNRTTNVMLDDYIELAWQLDPDGPPNCPVLSPTLTMARDGRPPGVTAAGGDRVTEGGTPFCEDEVAAVFFLGDDMDGGVATVLTLDDGVEHAEIELFMPLRPSVELVAPADRHTKAGDVLHLRVPGEFFASRNVPPPTVRPLGSLAVEEPLWFEAGAYWELGGDGRQFALAGSGGVGVTAVASDGTTDLVAEVPVSLWPDTYRFRLHFGREMDFVPMPLARCEGLTCAGKISERHGSMASFLVTVD